MKTVVALLAISLFSFAAAADEPAVASANISAPAPVGLLGLPDNVGPIDSTLRVIFGAGLLGGGAAITALSTAGQGSLGMDQGTSTIVGATMMGISAIPLLTAGTKFCPIYAVMGIDRSF